MQSTPNGSNYIVIVSRQDYGVARQALLDSISRNMQWPTNRIIIVFNGEPDDRVHVDDATGTIFVHTVSNIFEYTGFFVPNLIGASHDDAFLLLHDTCVARDTANSMIEDAFKAYRMSRSNYGTNILWCSSTGLCNLAIFDVVTSRAVMDRLGHVLAVRKMYAISLEHNWHKDSIKQYTDIVQHYMQEPSISLGTATPYGSVERHVLFFPTIGIEKYYVNVSAEGQHPNRP